MAIKTAVVGMGQIGSIHAGIYKDNPLSELVAVCDPVKEKADRAAEAYGCRAFYNEEEMLCAMPEIEAVSVATAGYDSGSMHFEPAMIALSYGKHALVENPLCADIRDARALVAYAEKQKLYLGCDLNHYFTGPARDADQMIAAGEVGELVYCIHRAGFNGGEKRYEGMGSPRWQTPYAHLISFCTHSFSVMRHFCGDIAGVQAFLSKPGVRAAAMDPLLSVCSIHVKFANGGVGYLLSQRGDAVFGPGGSWSYEHAGTRGTFCIENAVEKLHYWDAGKAEDPLPASPKPVTRDYGVTGFADAFRDRIGAFLEDIQNEVPREYLRASGRDGLAALEYAFAAIKSYENGGALVAPEALPPLHGDITRVW